MDEFEMLEPQEDTSAGSGAMSDSELFAALSAHEYQAVGYYTSEIAIEQAQAIDAYYGRPYGDERAGRSKVVDHTVAIAVDNAVAAIIKPFVSADDAVVFEPKGPEDEEQAEQATEYTNYVFNVDNSGFLLLHNWFKAALLEKLGVVKVWWEDSEAKHTERMEGLDAAQVELVMSEAEAGDYEIVGGPYQDDDGLFAIDVEREVRDGRVKIITVPSEEFLISPYARDIESAEYVAHRPKNVTRSDLLDMGFDYEVVKGLSATSSGTFYDPRTMSRLQDENYAAVRGNQSQGAGNDPSRDIIALIDEYVLIDYDGDGIAERRRVIRVADEILLNEQVEECPFAVLCPVPMPHKVYGLSIADQTRDLQRISTALWRQTLDNLYLANNPKIEVPANAITSDGATFDDLENPEPGGIVRTAAPGMINPIAVPFIADKSFPMLEYIEQQQEARTGIGRSGQGLDTNALRKSGQMTATEAADMIAGKNSRAEMIARIFAETGVKRLFRLILKLLVRHQPRARMIRLRNKWVEIDPRGWNAEMDMSITVGLGVGSQMERIAQADAVIEKMAAVVQSPFGQLVGPEEAYHAIKRYLNAAGIKDVEQYLKDPTTMPPEEPAPDPEMVKVQAEQQQAQAKLQLEAQKAEADIQVAQEKNAATIEAQREKAALDMQLARDKAQAEYELAVEKMRMEFELAREKMQMEAEIARETARLNANAKAASDDADISSYRAGGDLSE